jgi:DNA replication protein DnaD
MAKETPMFDLTSCRFAMQRSKESTARVVLYKELEIESSYTLECTYCGFEYGDRKGTQISIQDELMLGEQFCTSLLKYLNRSKENPDSLSTPKKQRKKTKTKTKSKKASILVLDPSNREDAASNDSSSSDENEASPLL